MRCFGPSHSILFAIPQQPSTLIACLVYWPRVVWKTQKKKRMMKKAVLCICCVLSLHVLVSPDSVRLPHSQPPALPPFTSFQWYSPWDKAQGRWAKRNSGESCEEGVALVGTQSGSPACAHDSPSRSSGTSAVRNERNRSDIQKCLCCSEKVWRILHEQQRLLEAAGAALSNNHTIVVAQNTKRRNKEPPYVSYFGRGCFLFRAIFNDLIIMFIDEDNKDRSGWSTSSTTDYSVSEVDQFNVAFLNWQYIKTIVISSHFVVLNMWDFLLRNTK